MRLIDADALKESLEIWEDYDELFVGNIRKYIDEAPTIEPRKGKWKEHKDYPGLAYLCSECGYFTTMRTNFCPNCGADMREGGEDE